MDPISRIQYLLLRYINDAYTPQEFAELMTLWPIGSEAPEVEELLLQEIRKASHPPDEIEIDWEGMLKKIVAAPAERTVPVKRLFPFRRKIVGAAAAILILLATGVYFWQKQTRQDLAQTPKSQPLTNDIAPGRSQAILTLSGGQTIILDSAQKGSLVTQGNARIIKTDSDRLTYHSLGNSIVTANTYNTLTTPRGGKYQLTLQDGTQVWLNAASSITYPTAFTGNDRTVTITGEAYFEIAQNPKQPFFVKTGGLLIEVLGTHFNVNAYPDEPSINTTLLEGKVRVSQGSRTQNLTPGEQASLTPTGQIQLLRNVDTEQVMAWKNGKFIFGEKTDIRTIMRQLARWYAIDVEYQGTITQHFGGSISRNVNVSEVLNMLETTGGVHFKINDKKVMVMP